MSSETHLQNDDHAPRTLQDWLDQKGQSEEAYPRQMWTKLEPFFLTQGYTLWPASSNPLELVPPNDAPRTPDGFAYTTVYDDEDTECPRYTSVNSINCPARTTDNRDVLIRIMAIGQDRGEKHRAALARLAKGTNALHGSNHVVPVLREIVNNDMVFAVFPLLSIGFNFPWYYCFSEVVDAVEQVLEGINFCHDNLVAHLDIDKGNILINWGGTKSQATTSLEGEVSPFRAYFPVRYYLNDFELAATFDHDSEPSSKVVSGLPITGIRTGEYTRDVAPEMQSNEFYCPFRADIWQLGMIFKANFGHLGYLSQPLVDVFEAMCAEDPNSRPLSSVALETVREIQQNLSSQALRSKVPDVRREKHLLSK